MSQSPQIQSRINTIAKEIAEGRTNGLVEKFGKKWNLKKSAINNYIKYAKPIARNIAELKDKAVKDEIVVQTKEAVKSGLKGVFEVDTKLQEIIFNNHKLIRDGGKVVKVENTTADQLKAIDLFYKRNGHYAPDEANIKMETSVDEAKFNTIVKKLNEIRANRR